MARLLELGIYGRGTPDSARPSNPGRTPCRAAGLIAISMIMTALILAAIKPVNASERSAVTIFAAASTTDAITAVNALFEEKGWGRIAVSFASSSTLAKQIDNGAPADIFLSASSKWMDYLADRRMIDPSSRRDLLSNRIVLIAPTDSLLVEIRISAGFPLAALLDQGRLVMGDPSHVPAGIYGRQALTTLGVWENVASRIAPTKDVRAALMLVERGEAPVGLVYATDAANSAKVRVLAVFPPDCHPAITYPVAMIRSRQSDSVRRYIEFLASHEARAVFESYGFVHQ